LKNKYTPISASLRVRLFRLKKKIRFWVKRI